MSLSRKFLPGRKTLNEALGFLKRVHVNDIQVKNAPVKELLSLIGSAQEAQAVQALATLYHRVDTALNNASTGIIMTAGKKNRIALIRLYFLALTSSIKNQLHTN